MNIVNFQDRGFELAVKRFLNISSGGVLRTDLLKINGIIISDGQTSNMVIPLRANVSAHSMHFPNFIFDVTESDGEWEQDLKQFSHISILVISVPSKDLSVLNEFENLRELYVRDSQTQDWTFLSTLSNLASLYLRNCNFSDLRPLEKLYKLQLEMFKNNNDVPPWGIKMFEGLKKLSLCDCRIKDIYPLKECIYIDDLNLSKNDIKDINPLKNMRRLYYLTLKYNKVEDLTPLINIPMIYLLNLRHNHIRDITPLKNHRARNLSRLFLANNLIEDYTPLRGLQLVRHDLDEKILGQINGVEKVLCESEDLVGKWSSAYLSDNEEDNLFVVFEENGRGFLYSYDINFNYIVIDTFKWYITNGKLTIKGINYFEFEAERLISKEKSKLAISQVEVIGYISGGKRKSVKTLEFDTDPGNPDEHYLNDDFVFISKEIVDTKLTKRMHQLIWQS